MTEILTKRVLIMAGGTGGHIFPGLAVAKYLKTLGASVHWLGSKTGFEVDFLKGKDIALELIDIKGVRGKGFLQLLRAPFFIAKSIYQALIIIQKVKPDVVLGMGGFVSGPGAIAALLQKIPVVIHEQNAVMGTTNRIVSTFAKKVLVGFPNTFLGAIVCGNPINKKIASLSLETKIPQNKNNRAKLLILGGSRGASSLNLVIPQALAMLDKNMRPEVLHQTGRDHFQKTNDTYRSELPVNCLQNITLVPFIDDMSEAYQWADFVICRSGALTISELASVGICSILVPFPHATDNHQFKNAQILARVGSAEIVEHKNFNAQLMSERISFYSKNRKLRQEMSEKAGLIAKSNSDERVAKECIEVINNGSS